MSDDSRTDIQVISEIDDQKTVDICFWYLSKKLCCDVDDFYQTTQKVPNTPEKYKELAKRLKSLCDVFLTENPLT